MAKIFAYLNASCRICAPHDSWSHSPMPSHNQLSRTRGTHLTRVGNSPWRRVGGLVAKAGANKISNYLKKSSGSGRRRSVKKASSTRRTSTRASAAAYDGGSSGCVLSFRRKNKYMRGFKRILAPQILNSVCGGSISTVANRQTPAQLLAYTGSGGFNSTYLMSLVDNGDMAQVLSALDPATTVSGSNLTGNTRRYMIDSIRAKYQLKNQTTIPITVTLYDCVARRDNTSDSFSPTFAWTQGIADEAVNVGSNQVNAQGSQFPGAKPFQSQLFCQRWKVKRGTTFILHPGATHCHYITIKPSGLCNFEYTGKNAYIKGLTTCLMAVLKGGVAASSLNAADVGESIAEVQYVTETQYKFKAMEKSRTALTQFNTLAGLADRTINEDTDTIMPNVQQV